MLFDHYTLQRVVNHETGRGWLVLCDKEATELARCDMPAEVLAFHLKRSRLERDALDLPADQDLDVELSVWADLDGKTAGRLTFEDGTWRELTDKELRAVLRLDKQQKRVAQVERQLLGELVSGYVSTLPIDETEETTQTPKEGLQ